MTQFDDDYPKNNQPLVPTEQTNTSSDIKTSAEIYNHAIPGKEGQYPSEIVELPSRGLVYPTNNPLSIGSIEMKYMTAREEDILTSQNLIQKGVVFDKLLQSLIITNINYNDLLIGDKNALLVAARIMAYGKDYHAQTKCSSCGAVNDIIINLQEFDDKPILDEWLNRDNRYDFELPNSKIKIAFKLLTVADDRKIGRASCRERV